MLGDKATYTTIPVSNMKRARRFYEETLGLKPEMVTEGGVMYRSGGSQLFRLSQRLQGVRPHANELGGRRHQGRVAELRAKGIDFEDSTVPGVTTVDGVSQVGRASGPRTSATRTEISCS